MSELYRPEIVPLGDYRWDGGECRWFAWIGGPGCDNCGKSASQHEGDLRTAHGAGPFDKQSVGRVWSDEIRAKWAARGVALPPRIPDDHSDQADFVEWAS